MSSEMAPRSVSLTYHWRDTPLQRRRWETALAVQGLVLAMRRHSPIMVLISTKKRQGLLIHSHPQDCLNDTAEEVRCEDHSRRQLNLISLPNYLWYKAFHPWSSAHLLRGRNGAIWFQFKRSDCHLTSAQRMPLGRSPRQSMRFVPVVCVR